MMNRAKRALLFITIWCTGVAPADAAGEPHVPGALEDWVGWVLHGEERVLCPSLVGGAWDPEAAERRICSWPGTLEISAGAAGAEFTQAWELYGPSDWIALPGDAVYWPENVRIDGERARLVARNDRPYVWAAAGRHRITGKIRWEARPQELPVDASVGLVQLQVDGRVIANPQRSRHGLWLGERPQASEARDQLTAHVHRLVEDDVPTRLVTRIRLDVSGNVREVSLGPVLPEGLVPLHVESDLPARLESDGRLRVQVRPGNWTLRVEARAATVVNQWVRPATEGTWVETEIWSLQGHPELRVVLPIGGRPVDPDQTDVPDEWADYPAFALGAGESIRLDERSRGETDRDNRLRLVRTLWLDFDRQAYTARDSVAGQMFKEWRLSMVAPFELLSAYDERESDHLLVTEAAEPSARGIEVRQSSLSLTTISRVPRASRLPVSGWRQRLESVSLRLHLPPGYRLLGAPGSGSVTGSWISRWRLIDMFLALFTCVAAGKLFGRRVGVLALAAMVLGVHESGAPSWAWLNLLAATALFRFAPEGKLRTIARGYSLLSVVAVAALLVPLAANQVKFAIYPQLEQASRVVGAHYVGPAAGLGAPSLDLSSLGYVGSGKARAAEATQEYQRYAPDALVQTGPGVPDWQWLSYSLHWSGPVEPEEAFRLVIAPPAMVSIWRLVVVATMGMLLFAIARGTFPGGADSLKRAASSFGDLGVSPPGAAVLLVVAATVAGLTLATPKAVLADTPSPEILEELKARLTAAPVCLPHCAELLSATVRIGRETLEIELATEALTHTAIRLPGSETSWLPTTVVLNGSGATGVFRDDPSGYWIPLATGRHRITLRGPLPAVASLSIPFARAPRVITVVSRGWKVTGVDEHRLVSGALELTRLSDDGEIRDSERWETNRFPPFVRVHRKLVFDLDWVVETTVQRVAPEEGAISMSIPLLAGESVTTPNVPVEEDFVLASLSGLQEKVAWRSTLAQTSPLTLTAPADGSRDEVWTLGASNIWHPQTDGLPASQVDYAEGAEWQPIFRPRPGERLTIEIERPVAAEGSTLAIDSVHLATEIGARSRASTLSFDYRSTRGAQQVITLPGAARVASVSIGEESLPLQAVEGRLGLPVRPGEHKVSIRFVEDDAVGLVTRSSPVDLGIPASNVRTTLRMPESRWILATRGDGVGPAVLYWSELAALALVAFLLGRTHWTPLGLWQWFLLGLGFSTFSWIALAVVVVWFLLLGCRERLAMPETAWRYNLLQVALALTSVVALVTLIVSVSIGLLGRPDMHIAGRNSGGSSLGWFLDRAAGPLPDASVLAAPMWIYKTAILAWALWLSFALLRWLPWAWRSLNSRGLWRTRKPAES